jgi:predicted nucleotide-binding protein (sugar kinase/HSP70/actin superfamily)
MLGYYKGLGVRGQGLEKREALNFNNDLLTPISSFKGFNLSKRNYEIKSFECKGCDNLCEINRVKIEGEDEPLFYGSRCEKYDVKRKKQESFSGMPDLFKEREELLLKSHKEYAGRFKDGAEKKPRIGIPRIFFFHDYLPLWSTFFWELGFTVELSDDTNRQIINKGVESILSESCFPHKVAHGHIKDLIEKKLDAVFLPSFINFNDAGKDTRGFACPYAQTIPYLANIAFGSQKRRFLEPVINMEHGKEHIIGELKRVLTPFNISLSSIRKALKKAEKAQEDFEALLKRRGSEVLNNLPERIIVIIGRSYNAFDPGINLEIPKKLSGLGVFSVPMDYLPLSDINIADIWPNMYWRSGEKILKAAELIRDNPKLFPLYIGNFSCGPDSFIHRYFHETISDKPFLHIEIDEHSADAGVITRCEAFLDSIAKRKDLDSGKPERVKLVSIRTGTSNKRIVYIPRMSDHSFALAAAFETCGLEAEVMERPSAETVKIGRKYVSGKECYPCAVTTGDMVSKTMSGDFNPDRAAFFMPSGTGPCRFGQYNVMHRLILDEIGLQDVPIFSPNQDETFYRELGIVGSDFATTAWKGIIATEMLIKCLHEARPHEVNAGEADKLYSGYLKKISTTVKSSNGAMPELLLKMRDDFSLIKRDGRKRPLIGIIGEIFVRQNSFSNEELIRKIEALGGEVWLAPVEEWIYYVNLMALRKALLRVKNNLFSKGNAADLLNICLTRFVQDRVDRKYSEPFKGFLKTLHEPATKTILKNASPYLHDSFEGEAILSMGKAVDFVKNRASGIICAMPFGCMPGTIVTALLKGLKQDAGIPCLSMAYDGAEAASSAIQLEAFMHQANEYSKQ